MAICSNCGAPCGTRHSANWRGNRYLCDKCYDEHNSNVVKIILGVMFLALSAVMAFFVSWFALKPIHAAFGYQTAKVAGIAIGVGCVVLYVFIRHLTKNSTGCLARMFFKTIGVLVFAVGVGLLILSFLLEDSLKDLLGEKAKDDAPVAETAPAGEATTGASDSEKP